MGVLTNIGGIPLFSTPQEALSWARANGLSGYHTHTFGGITGYMGGSTHAVAVQRTTNTTISASTSTPNYNPGTGSGGSGSGGGGY